MLKAIASNDGSSNIEIIRSHRKLFMNWLAAGVFFGFGVGVVVGMAIVRLGV